MVHAGVTDKQDLLECAHVGNHRAHLDADDLPQLAGMLQLVRNPRHQIGTVTSLLVQRSDDLDDIPRHEIHLLRDQGGRADVDDRAESRARLERHGGFVSQYLLRPLRDL